MERYLKVETIGRGSYAKVKKVKLAVSGEVYAMKVVKKSLLKRRRQWSAAEGRYKNAYDDVLREVALMKKLNHPNVIRMHEVVDDPEKDKLCIVLDYHENGALMDTSCLPDDPIAPLSREDCRRFFADVVEGLTYLHFQNVVHFDLKPDNVLVSKERRGIIADFGVSRMLADADRASAGDDVLTSGSPGTPMYLAPEVWGDTKYYGKTADIWSLGVTLFVMVFGYTPFQVASHDELVEEVTRPSPVRIPAELHDAKLGELLQGLLSKDPKARLSLADAASHPWLEAANKPRGLARQYSRITVNAAEIRAAVTIAGHANSFARDAAGRIVKRTRKAERDCYEAITGGAKATRSGLAAFVPPYHGELTNADAVSSLLPSGAASPLRGRVGTDTPTSSPLAPKLGSGLGARLGRSSDSNCVSSGGASSSSLPPPQLSAAQSTSGARTPQAKPASAIPMPSVLAQMSSTYDMLGQLNTQLSGASIGSASKGKGGDSGELKALSGDGRDTFIVLDDVTEGMADACVMDIKMGTRTFTDSDMRDTTARPDLLAKMVSLDKSAPTEEERRVGAVTKMRYLTFRESLTTTAHLGFRIDAMKIGDDPNLNDTPLNFRRGPTDPTAVLRELTRFVCSSKEVAAAFAKRLRELRAALEADTSFFPTYTLIRSSLLFTYDHAAVAGGGPGGRPEVGVGVHMIDFSSSKRVPPGSEPLTHRAAWREGSAEDGYLNGVDNLIAMFDKVVAGETAWDAPPPTARG